MDKLALILFFFSLFSIVTGVIFQLPVDINGINIYLFDIAACLTFIFTLFNIKRLKNIILNNQIVGIFGLFIFICLLSMFFSPINLTISKRLISALYIVRMLAYFSVYLSVINLLQRKILNSGKIIKYLSITGVILAIIGWLQYFLYPDLRNLFYLGWDPHYKRIFSTFFDPNYFGLMMVLTLITLFTWKESLRNTFQVAGWFILKGTPGRWILVGFIFFTLLFTYSRSSFMALLISVSYYMFIKKKIALLLILILIFFTGIFFLPRPAGAGTQLERIFSINERITSMYHGIQMILKHPVLGVGYNSLRYAKIQFGFIDPDQANIHSSAGIENSFIFVTATTGLIGLIIYLIILTKIYINANNFVRISLVAIFVHSLFLNSFFFPPVMMWFWIIAALDKEVKGYK